MIEALIDELVRLLTIIFLMGLGVGGVVAGILVFIYHIMHT